MPKHAQAKRETSAKRETGLRPFWSGTLSFGLVSVPVDLYAGTHEGGVALRMLGPDGTPLARHYHCPKDDVDVPNEELVHGFEVAPDEFVTVTDDELAALEPQKSRDIDLQLFVPASAIDPVYFERSFLLAPTGDSTKAYQLLSQVMQRSDRVGIATFVMRDREYLVAIAAQDGLLRAETLRFHDEVRSIAGVGLPRAPKLGRAAIQRFTDVIEKHTSKEFDPSTLEDEAAERIRELAAAKQRRKKDVVQSDVVEVEDQGARVLDLMQMLKRSLKEEPAAKAGAAKPKKRAAR